MPCCCMNDFASLSADFTTPHFSADLPTGATGCYIPVFCILCVRYGFVNPLQAVITSDNCNYRILIFVTQHGDARDYIY